MTTPRAKRKGEMSNLPATRRRSCQSLAVAGIVLAALAAAPAKRAAAANPESPEVKRMVDRAVKWLETQQEQRLGGKCLIGLACFKAGGGLNHPKVQEALRACTSPSPGVDSPDYNYSM